MSRNVFEFVIYMIHACADKWGRLPSDVYRMLTENRCIPEFLVPLYDILHTQSMDFVVADIEEYSRNRGYTL